MRVSRHVVGAVLLGLSLSVACPASAATIGLSRDGSTIYLSGRIEQEDASRFNLVRDGSKATLVELDSKGGNLLAGVAIGMKVREAGMKALIRNGSTCASACGLIWASAKQRYLDDKAMVGFHSAYQKDDASKRTDFANDGIAKYLRSIGYGTDFIVFALQANPKEMQWLTYDKASRLGVAIADPDTLYGPTFVSAPAVSGPAVRDTSAMEPDMPRLVQVKEGRALLEVDEGLEVWARRGSRLPGGISVTEIGRNDVKVSWSGGSRRLSAAR